ncbi:cobyrinate a,c-diamide synthase [bacterium endosymbiont of Bathymodiolus sp. 5 South]|jgi:cobyrinic acid a,c-diamide synthase|uniref:cobyrinate a,c-diamide synthase n=1 Tax=bacterium endosymbiont of Bathymodiolus sp. 5 South TaxID=1181670 RepID=UPI0010B414EA|nr:cobyrinate a,c-diamide synthase [bacterium endosymbiont of Bathymodiolus sp. 5 South]CAC9632879.1 Protein similar to cobyrinic acid a,c-diamide synthetase clustered with dissimilatory sulfite reductase [uncultured Gammaproteobacteria bacterium]CAC9647474.1 Protein similar to cobyrinic acid a,c-diamide synthetase clustered with dissimilatory sulfite reductase [uncultured Gammaproteobacteria bacterium]SHN89249.1 Protein similar to cobyrinic acid a,c-diamide synthetase clustered with dissimilato
MSSSIYLSAAHKSSGKTVVSLGLCAAFKARTLKVQAFKKGPDYIDPIWLAQASGNPCYNLDFYTMSENEISALFHQQQSDIAIIEGNKGLYDGMNTTGGDANADMAKLLDTNVVLVIDSNGITRGVAPLLMGYQTFDTNVNIVGVILNKVAGERHESKLVQAIEYYTDTPVLGAVRRSKELVIDERHLGLMPANESTQSQRFINSAARMIADQVDLDKILSLASAKKLVDMPVSVIAFSNLTISVAKDPAFGFYYQDDLDAFKSLGVKIKYFDTLKASELPKCDGLFIGGGFPEMQLESLSSNQSLLADIKLKIEQGLPTYAECGGLMYLSQTITHQGKSHQMVGVIQANTVMTPKPIGRGYVQLAPTDQHPWEGAASVIYAHEFHYSKLENINPKTRYAYKVLRGVGVDNKHDGILTHNLLATYTHLRSVGGNRWVEQFVNFVRKNKE